MKIINGESLKIKSWSEMKEKLEYIEEVGFKDSRGNIFKEEHREFCGKDVMIDSIDEKNKMAECFCMTSSNRIVWFSLSNEMVE